MMFYAGSVDASLSEESTVEILGEEPGVGSIVASKGSIVMAHYVGTHPS